MANNQFPADWAIELPNLYPPPGEAMRDALMLRERQAERQFAYNERDRLRKEAEDKANRLYNLREIDADTDPTKYKTGEQAFDAYSINELNKIKEKALAEYINLPEAEMEYRLMSDMKDFLGWHSAAQSNIDKIKQGLTDLNKTYPNIDATRVHDYAFNNLATDFIKDGQRVDPMYIKPRDYVAEIQNNNLLGGFVNDVSPLAEYVQGFKPQTYSDTKYVDNKGYKHDYSYTAAITPFSELVTDKDGKPIGVQLKSESIDAGRDANGMPVKMKVLPEEAVTGFLSIPKVKAAALGLWAQMKPTVSARFMQATGKQINPATEDILFRKFLYDYVETNNLDQHYFKENEKTAVPRPPSTNVFINQQQPFNPQTSGTELDRVGSVKPLVFNKAGVQISNGVVRDKNGNLFTGENLTIRTEDLPAGLVSVLKTGGVDANQYDYWKAKISNGRIEAIKPEDGSWIDRQDIFNYQLKSNTEPIKSTQPEYGNPNLSNKISKKGILD